MCHWCLLECPTPALPCTAGSPFCKALCKEMGLYTSREFPSRNASSCRQSQAPGFLGSCVSLPHGNPSPTIPGNDQEELGLTLRCV